MSFIKVLLLCLAGAAEIALVRSKIDMRLDTLMANLFLNNQQQGDPDALVFESLEEANDLFERGIELVWPVYAKYQDTVKLLVEHCRPDAELPECSLVEDFQKYNQIASINTPAIDSLLKTCKTNILKNCASKLLDKIRQDDPIIPYLWRSINKNLNVDSKKDRSNKGKYGRDVGEVMLDMDSQAVIVAVRKFFGSKKAYEVEFERIIGKNCRDFIEKIDPRVKLYETYSFGEQSKAANDVVAWNSVANHCKEILDNKESIMDSSYKSLRYSCKGCLK